MKFTPAIKIELAACPCVQEGQWHPGVHQEECGQQAKGGDRPPLLCPREATAGILCLILVSTVQEKQGATGKDPLEGHEGNKESGASLF